MSKKRGRKASLAEAKQLHKKLKEQAKEAKRKAKEEKKISKKRGDYEPTTDLPDSEKYARKVQERREKIEKLKRKQDKIEARTLRARFVSHVTVLDGTVVSPCATFVKVWKIRNDGTTAWPAGTRFTFLPKSDSMGGPSYVTLDKAVQVGQEIEISLQLTAPEKEGYYEGLWRFSTPAGFKFGQRMSASIHVLHNDEDEDSLSSSQTSSLSSLPSTLLNNEEYEDSLSSSQTSMPSSLSSSPVLSSFPCDSRGSIPTTSPDGQVGSAGGHEDLLAEVARYEAKEAEGKTL